jgi:hypothetical protein
MYRIIEFVSLADLQRLSIVNRHWYRLSRDETVWKRQTQSMFGQVPRRGGSWYWTFQQQYQSQPVVELLVPLRGLTRPSSLSLFRCLHQLQMRHRVFSTNRDLRIYLAAADSYFLELKKMATLPAWKYLHREDQIRSLRSSPVHGTHRQYPHQSTDRSTLRNSSMRSSLDLPDEIALQILELLDVSTIGRLSQVNTKWSQVCGDEKLWQYLVRRDFGSIQVLDNDDILRSTSLVLPRGRAYQTYQRAYTKLSPVQLMIRLRGLTTPQSIEVLRCLWENGLTYIAPYQDPPQIVETEVDYFHELSRILVNCPHHPVISYLDLNDLAEAAQMTNEFNEFNEFNEID